MRSVKYIHFFPPSHFVSFLIYNYTTPSLSHLQMERRRLRSHGGASIVRLLGQRALTGRMPSMEAHVHSDYVAVLWKRPRAAGCFEDCIVRHTIDNETYLQLRDSMRLFDSGAPCTFRHICLNNVRKSPANAEGTTYLPKQERHSLLPQWVRDHSESTCHCPQVASSTYDRGELITMGCMRHSDGKIIEPTFVRLSDFCKGNISIWLTAIAEEDERSVY
jgi:hypothetical protein